MLQLDCDHRIPGVESDVLVSGSGFKPGIDIAVLLTGPPDGVVGDGIANVTVGADGTFMVALAIRKFGDYTVTVESTDPSVPVLEESITIDQQCPKA